MKINNTESIKKSGIPRTTFYKLVDKYPSFEKFALISVIGSQLINADVIEDLTKKTKD